MVKLTALTVAQNMDSKAPKRHNEALDEALETKIIDLLIENNKLSQMDIVNRLGYSRASVQRTMKKLVENGIIERKGGKRFGFWEIHN